MLRDRAVRFGMIGVILTALCCFTPILVVLLAATGIGWAIGYLDYVLLPMLLFFAGVVVYALLKRTRVPVSIHATDCVCGSPQQKPTLSQGDVV